MSTTTVSILTNLVFDYSSSSLVAETKHAVGFTKYSAEEQRYKTDQ